MIKPKLLDVVALLKELPEEKLMKGQVGTVVELLAEGVYEVEFSDRQGRTITMCALSESDLLVLHYELEAV
ncbi:MAG: DUF4926 domain-containing protein [Bacteroidetes bacterium]|nr:DUF4926 domain-containing protein [Fibrella sp.]